MTHRDLKDLANARYCENQVFYNFTNNSKSRQNFRKRFRILFLKHLLTTILDTELKKFHAGFFELEIPEIFTRAFLLKISIRT